MTRKNKSYNIHLSSCTVNEFATNGTVVATISATDSDGEFEIVGDELRVKDTSLLNYGICPSNNSESTSFRHTLTGQDVEAFEIVENELRVKDFNLLDCEDCPCIDININAFDGSNHFHTDFTILINSNEDITTAEGEHKECFEIVGDELRVKDGTLLKPERK